MGITVALTGSSGNMGRETLPALLSLPFVDKIKPTTSSILPRSFRPIPTTRLNLRAPATLRAFRTL